MGKAKGKSAGGITAALARAVVAEAEGQAGDVIIGEDDALEAEHDAMESLAALDDGEGGTSYTVKCLTPAEKAGTLMRISRAEIPDLPWTLRDSYGPGTYSVHAVGRSGYIKGSHRIIKISTLAAAKAAPAASTGMPSSMSDWERARDEREERRRQEQREDRKFMLQLFSPLLVTIAGNLISKPASLAEQADTMLKLKQLSGGDGGSEKALELVMKGAELADKFGGKGGGDSWAALIREGLQEARGLLGGMRAAPAAAGAAYTPPPRLAAPAATPTADGAAGSQALAQPAPTTAPAGDTDMLAMARPLLTKLAAELHEFAENGADPGLAAEALMGKVPRWAKAYVTPGQMLEWLQRPDWWEHTVHFAPALAPYQGYCDDVRITLVDLFSKPDRGAEADDATA